MSLNSEGNAVNEGNTVKMKGPFAITPENFRLVPSKPRVLLFGSVRDGVILVRAEDRNLSRAIGAVVEKPLHTALPTLAQTSFGN